MIVTLVDDTGEHFGTFQSPAVPRRGETVSYEDTAYVVEDVHWSIETRHDQNIETVRLFVHRAED